MQDFREHWMPDESVKECYECGLPFYALRRRHHCRVCGQIMCSKCGWRLETEAGLGLKLLLAVAAFLCACAVAELVW